MITNEWIKISDKTPLTGKDGNRIKLCLCFNGDAPEYNQHVFQATFFRQRMDFVFDHKILGTVTHWMPLPEPPKI